MSEIEKTCKWFVATEQMPEQPTPSAAQSAFYLGMQLEELAEKLEVVLWPDHTTVQEMHRIADSLKAGKGDSLMQSVLAAPGNAEKMLDADMDLLWVSMGAARAQGADVLGAYNTVADANWDKAVDGVFQKHPETRKVMKRPGWTAPDLKPFTHKSLP